MFGGFNSWLHWKVLPYRMLARMLYRLRHGLGHFFPQRYQDFPEDVILRQDCPLLGENFRGQWRKDQGTKRAKTVVFLLDTMETTGGVLSVVQLAEDLQALGWEVHLGVRSRYNFVPLTEKVDFAFYANDQQLCETLPATDYVVATYWPTAFSLMHLYLARKNFTPLYFVQDFEPRFYAERYAYLRQCVAETYLYMPYCFAKTQWLCEQVRAAGGAAEQVPPGLDLERFSPVEQKGNVGEKKILLTMFRLSTPQRGNAIALDVLRAISATREDVEIHLFGSTTEALKNADLDFPYVNYGVVDNTALPALYRQAYCYLDSSTFHGFGRTIAEAMACGIPCVLTDSGGVRDFAVHEKNCLMAKVGDVDGLVAQLQKLLQEPEERDRLADACRESVAPFERMASAHATAALWEEFSRSAQ